MPTYEYRCQKCRKKFSRVMSISEHETRRIKCPKCGGTKISQLVSNIQVVTSKKS